MTNPEEECEDCHMPESAVGEICPWFDSDGDVHQLCDKCSDIRAMEE